MRGNHVPMYGTPNSVTRGYCIPPQINLQSMSKQNLFTKQLSKGPNVTNVQIQSNECLNIYNEYLNVYECLRMYYTMLFLLITFWFIPLSLWSTCWVLISFLNVIFYSFMSQYFQHFHLSSNSNISSFHSELIFVSIGNVIGFWS